MAEQTISITLNGEKKEVAADQTGVQLFPTTRTSSRCV